MNSVIKVERKLGLKAGDDGRGPRKGVAAGGGGKGRAPPSLKQRKKKKPRPFYQDSSSSSADDESEYTSEVYGAKAEPSHRPPDRGSAGRVQPRQNVRREHCSRPRDHREH